MTPLGFCEIKTGRSALCFGPQDPAYVDMAYFPDNDLHMAVCAGDLDSLCSNIALWVTTMSITGTRRTGKRTLRQGQGLEGEDGQGGRRHLL